MKIPELHKIDEFNKLHNIALLGFPGSGKSTIFRLLTDFKGNNEFESTFQLYEQNVQIGKKPYKIFDLPGIFSLTYTKPTEKISFSFLQENNIDLIICVIDSTLLNRSLKLAIELIEIGKPIIIVLNFQDEAANRGIIINQSKIEELLQVPIVKMNARNGKGLNELVDNIENLMNKEYISPIFRFTRHIENEVVNFQEFIESKDIIQNLNPRFVAIKTLENPSFFPDLSNSEIINQVEKIEKKVYEEHQRSLFETLSYERHHLAMKIAEEAAPIVKNLKIPFQDKLDKYITHPKFGYLILLSLLFIFFFSIFYIGNFLSTIFEVPLLKIPDLYEPLKTNVPFIWYSINGAYMGLLGALGIVLPYFLPLVFLNSLMEETGYMSRIVLLIDNLMHKIGLHGKSIIPFIMGLGCSVPALYSTRMLENRRDRIITAVLIPLIPCSARLTVIFALSAAFAGPFWVIVIFLYIMAIIAGSGIILSNIFPQTSGLLMEINPLKIPSFRVSFLKTWNKVREFLGEALLFLVLGGILLGWIEYFHFTNIINNIFSPMVSTLLDLPKELGSTLIFGFFRKELILVMSTQALGVRTINELPLTLSQIITYIIFVSLYFPCLSTFIVLLKEFKIRITLISSIASIIIAIISAIFFRALLSF